MQRVARRALREVDPDAAAPCRRRAANSPRLCAVVEASSSSPCARSSAGMMSNRLTLMPRMATSAFLSPMSLSTPSASPPNCSTRNSISLAVARRASMSERSIQPLSNSQRLRTGRADHRAVPIDEPHVLHRGALVDVEPDRLERGGAHVASSRPASSSRLAAAKSTANSDRRSTTSVSSSSRRACWWSDEPPSRQSDRRAPNASRAR